MNMPSLLGAHDQANTEAKWLFQEDTAKLLLSGTPPPASPPIFLTYSNFKNKKLLLEILISQNGLGLSPPPRCFPGWAQGSFHLDSTEICPKDRCLNFQKLPANLSPFET